MSDTRSAAATNRRRLVGAAALVYLALVVLAPLLLTVDTLGSFELGPSERRAIVSAARRGLAAAGLIGLVTTGLALLCAWTVQPALLLASLLIGRALVAQGVLALLEPGALAAGLTLVLDLLPFAALLAWLRLRTYPLDLDEAARDLGASRWTRLRTVAWPHLRPSLIVIAAWVALQVLGDVTSFELAGGGHIYTPGLLIRDALVREAAPARALSSIVVLLALAMACAWALARELDQAWREDWRALAPAPTPVVVLGHGLVLAALAVPLVAAVAPLLDPATGAAWGPADRAMAELGARSIGLATALAALATAAGFGLALLARSSGAKLTTALAALTPLAIPPSVLGLLYLQLGDRLGLEPGLALTGAALLGPTLALGFVCGRLATFAVPSSLVDAAADLGASARDRLRTLWWPLASLALALAAIVVAAWVLAQAAIPSFTSGPGGDTLAVGLTIHARAGAMAVVGRWSLISLGLAGASAALVGLLARRSRLGSSLEASR